MPFTIIRHDITKMQVDAIVNAANINLLMGGGVCGAIFKSAGETKLQHACKKLSPIKTGDAVITSGFNLPAKYIIHTAGPVFNPNYTEKCEELLTACYQNSLALAKRKRIKSIAFPLISSGIYGYPKDEALRIAKETIIKYLDKHEIDVYLVVFDDNSFAISQNLSYDIKSYIDKYYVKQHTELKRQLLDVEQSYLECEPCYGAPCYDAPCSHSLDDIIENLDEPFSHTLLRLIDTKGKTDVEVYKKANIDRKLFSKIRTGKNYTPSKRTILALAISLELSLDETDNLLESAGFSLSHSQKFDIIVEYFIINKKYNIFEVNETLFYYDQPLLGK